MSLFRVASTKTDAYAENAIKMSGVAENSLRINVFVLGVLLVGVLFSSGVSCAASLQELKAEINKLVAAINKESSQNIDVINAINVAVAAPQSLTVGTVEGAKGMLSELPIYFKPGPSPIASIQFDVMLSTGLAIASAETGIAAQAAQKSIQTNPVPGGFRIIVFGLNSNIINAGPIVTLKVAVMPTVTSNKPIISIGALAASSPLGSAISITAKNGLIVIR